METYIVNGKEIQYDTFEAANIALYTSEVKRISDAANAAKATGADVIVAMREQCFNIMDFFDTVVGEGTAEELFGGSVNIRDVAQAFKDFMQSVNHDMAELAKSISGGTAPAATTENIMQYVPSAGAANRAQRRAAARAKVYRGLDDNINLLQLKKLKQSATQASEN